MDFSFTYTEEQERFRQEVRAWLKDHAPDLTNLGEPGTSTDALLLGRQFRRALAEQRWLAPTYPEEFGGGGLTEDHAVVLTEELAPWDLPQLGGLGLSLLAPALLAHGTVEQKHRFLPPILQGEVTVLQLFSEPGAGSDLSSIGSRGERDGDEFVINGQKVFKEQWYQVDYLYTLILTDPEGPARDGMTAFLIPTDVRGITVQYRSLGGFGGEERVVVLDNVRVPLENLLGVENRGWRLAQTSLDLERGGAGSIGVSRSGRSLLDDIIGWTKDPRSLGR